MSDGGGGLLSGQDARIAAVPDELEEGAEVGLRGQEGGKVALG